LAGGGFALVEARHQRQECIPMVRCFSLSDQTER
jgi:hypothetical protein